MLKHKRYGAKSEIVFNVLNYIFLTLVACAMLYPMWYVVCASFSDSTALTRYSGILLWPQEFSTAAYSMMLRNPMIIQGFVNSVIIMIVGTALNLVFTSICAYVLSRRGVLWNKFFSKFIIFTMFFNGGMIPTYLIVANVLHLNDTWWAIILPGLINVYNMIIMRTSFANIPDSLVESAQLDGATHWKILFRIVMPLSKAVIAVMILYYAVAHWNSWFNASIYLKERSKFPIQLILREILIANDTSSMSMGTAMSDQVDVGEVIKYATIVATTVPILIIYPFLQKYFVGGVMIGAVKG